MKILLVEWRDSVSDNSWISLESAKKSDTTKVVTVGILISTNRRRLVLLPTFSSRNNVLGEIAIPKGCITRVRKLKII